MTSSIPPTSYFIGINFNPNFYNLGDSALTFAYADSHFLRSTNYAVSRATYTQFYGTVYCFNGISGDGSQITNINVSNISFGILSVSRGGTGTNNLPNNQLLIGNGTNNVISTSNLTWNNTTNTLSATNFVGSGSNISNLDYDNIAYHKPNLSIYALQTYVDGSFNTINNTLSNKQNTISVSAPLVIDTSNNISINGSGITGLTGLNASNVTTGTLLVSRGGIGTTTLNNNQVLLGNGTNAINQTNNLLFDTSNNRLGICTTQPNYTLDVSGNINCNNSIRAISFIENSVSLINKYVKKYGFSFITATPIAIVSTPYYKYDINLNNYTTIVNFDGVVPTRKFKIMTWLKSGYHEVSPTSNLDYEIIMSNPSNNGTNGGQAGLNIQAYSHTDSKNYRLDKTASTGQFILRNSFDYLSYVSTVQTNIACLIIDYF